MFSLWIEKYTQHADVQGTVQEFKRGIPSGVPCLSLPWTELFCSEVIFDGSQSLMIQDSHYPSLLVLSNEAVDTR